MFSRCIADSACLYVEPAAAHAAMVDSASHHVAAHFAIAKRALVHHLLCHDASVFDLKSVATMPAVVYSARTHTAADGSLTKRARVVACVVRVLLGTARGRQLVRGARATCRSREPFATCVCGLLRYPHRARCCLRARLCPPFGYCRYFASDVLNNGLLALPLEAVPQTQHPLIRSASDATNQRQ